MKKIAEWWYKVFDRDGGLDLLLFMLLGAGAVAVLLEAVRVLMGTR